MQKLNSLGEIPEDAILVTIDVCSLYTNIPHKDGISATRRALDKRTNQEIPTDVLIHLLEIIL